jgi:anthranilate phosphoribosyltransferase
MIRDAITFVLNGRELSPPQAETVMREIVSGPATDAQIAAFLTAMQVKGPSAGEIAAFARVMRAFAVPLRPENSGMLLDTCGTGGDGNKSFNISTAAAFVAAGAGVPVVKHGNRSVSSRCGSADVLEELGVNLGLPPEKDLEMIKKIGIAFLYAPNYHPAMGRVAGVRREIGIRTVFNILGPLINPAGAEAQLIGVYSPELTGTCAEVLRQLGVRRAMVVHGNGLDEITTTGDTCITELADGRLTSRVIRGDDYGLPPADPKDITGGDRKENARILIEIFNGERGAHRDIVLLNSGAAIYTAGRSSSIGSGITMAAGSIDSGAAMEKLGALINASGGKE